MTCLSCIILALHKGACLPAELHRASGADVKNTVNLKCVYVMQRQYCSSSGIQSMCNMARP